METDFFVHPTACIDQPCQIGEGTRIWHFSHIMAGACIGRKCNIGQNVYIDRDTVVGDGCKLQNNVSIYKGVILEEEVFCGPSMVFTNVINPRAFIDRRREFMTTRVKKGATLGANSTILCGVTIGEYALVGAGAVITRDVSSYALMMGVPAWRAGWVCRCGVALPGAAGELTCPECGDRYRLDQRGRLQPTP
jgi:UDP-2-acetamido-3-amino-2,3-dideoxy-glucuronate N-acetyltransferase